MLGAMGNPRVRLRLWSGVEEGAPPEDSAGTAEIRDPGALLRILLDPELQVGELYVEDRLEIDALVPLLTAGFRANAHTGALQRLIPRRLIARALDTSLSTATRNAQHHYDLGNDFYELWLDERMVYTCAYFPTPEASLEEAQLAKLEHVCRKLALRPGEKVIEAGCGWGALALHMARYYGVKVRAFNVSREQVEYAREQAEKRGLSDRVEFVQDDYRNIDGRCDAFVSVGMLEHVGVDHYQTLGAVIERSLEPAGRGLVHSIGRSRPVRLNRWITKHVFPNAHPPTLSQMMQIFEPFDFAVLDVENLRAHYELTSAHWLERFEREYDRIEALVGRRRARTWRFYLAGGVASYAAGLLQLYQVVFTRAKNMQAPWHRGHVYNGDPAVYGEPGGAFGESMGAFGESVGAFGESVGAFGESRAAPGAAGVVAEDETALRAGRAVAVEERADGAG
jgi:cyclopropane-fatty-acyl-phospholipid synthase